ncbi:hypothetical protein ACTM7X_08015 [Citrobacter braakii]|jgi:hypothetical protein|uniref:hypothetical protein n=1 Tax=Citrobacter TaxID=544 RepID=UPI001EEFBB8C|nr:MULTISPECIES: hypothetical protein [Citrobacter]MDQ9168063.1 hypothetical protein [Citrobacter freundii]MDT7445553.1 hypothetical protein [Citrobacter freundii]MDU5553082.1 hypothetical protein [Citrobacter freundii]BEJ33053.1 hypothetical protein OIPHN330_16730 [Citrobacter freundii]BEJ33715.1 hypothetical protein OIPHN330_23350 [Citrobacter freundii]
MTLERQVESLEFKVGFPKENGVRISLGENLTMSSTQRIGSNVSVKIGKATVATIQYSEDLTPELTLEGYNQRAKEHAQNVVAKIIEAATNQAANGFYTLKLGIKTDAVL